MMYESMYFFLLLNFCCHLRPFVLYLCFELFCDYICLTNNLPNPTWRVITFYRWLCIYSFSSLYLFSFNLFSMPNFIISFFCHESSLLSNEFTNWIATLFVICLCGCYQRNCLLQFDSVVSGCRVMIRNEKDLFHFVYVQLNEIIKKPLIDYLVCCCFAFI